MELGAEHIGRRVVVRRAVPGERGPSGGPALTDVLGVLEAVTDETLRVRRLTQHRGEDVGDGGQKGVLLRRERRPRCEHDRAHAMVCGIETDEQHGVVAAAGARQALAHLGGSRGRITGVRFASQLGALAQPEGGAGGTHRRCGA